MDDHEFAANDEATRVTEAAISRFGVHDRVPGHRPLSSVGQIPRRTFEIADDGCCLKPEAEKLQSARARILRLLPAFPNRNTLDDMVSF